VFVQAANEAVAKNTQANPVATRFNMPRFPRVVLAFSLLAHSPAQARSENALRSLQVMIPRLRAIACL
jgi:hypothetical protein